MASGVQSFKWTGMNKQGGRISGVIQALDLKSAESELKAMEVDVISLAPTPPSLLSSFRRHIRPKEIVLFTRYLSTMLAAGMPILQSLEVISRDQENNTLKSVVASLRTSISSGATLAESLNKFPQYFNELYVNLTHAGEKSATLDKVLTRLVKYLEKVQRIKGKIKAALIYPMTIVAVAVSVSLILLLFVVPQFAVMFKNANMQLPYFTRIIIHISDFLRAYWWALLLLVTLIVLTVKRAKRTNEKFADEIDRTILRIWVIGPILKKAIIARFTRTLSITLEAGLPIVESMKSMINIMGNRIYSKGIQQICDDITGGTSLTTAMEKTKLFPSMVIQMISVGESSGTLGAMLNNIANYYEEEVDTIADNLSSLLEPFIIIILGIIIGAFVVAMYLPIFKLGTTI